MMVIKCKDRSMYPFKLKKCGRVKRILWDQRGCPYYRRGNMRSYLDAIERLKCPRFYEEETGMEHVISGWEYIGAWSPLYLEILKGGDAVQLWVEV